VSTTEEPLEKRKKKKRKKEKKKSKGSGLESQEYGC
jgi:hypothetical protein